MSNSTVVLIIDKSGSLTDSNSIVLEIIKVNTLVIEPDDRSKWQLTVDFIMIIGKYFRCAKDFINVMKVSKKYMDLVSMYKFNPISDVTLFENVQTQHFYNKCDLKLKKQDMFQYIHWYPVQYQRFTEREDNEIFKNVELNSYLIVFINDKDKRILPIEIENGNCIIPEGITKIGEKCFDSFRELKSVILPSTLKEIGKCAFRYCGLESVTIPYGVTSIRDSCFCYCHQLTHVDLPKGLKRIEDAAFIDTNIISITFPETLTMLGGDCVFADKNLKEINFPEHTLLKEYTWITDDESKVELIKIPEGVTKLCGSKLVLTLDKGIFILPSTLKEISDEVFLECYPKIYIPEGVTKIGNSSFSGYKNETIRLPDSLIEIGKCAFQFSNLEEVVIPANVKYIGDGCFRECENLKKIVVLSPYIESNDSDFLPVGFFDKIPIEGGYMYVKNDDD